MVLGALGRNYFAFQCVGCVCFSLSLVLSLFLFFHIRLSLLVTGFFVLPFLFTFTSLSLSFSHASPIPSPASSLIRSLPLFQNVNMKEYSSKRRGHSGVERTSVLEL